MTKRAIQLSTLLDRRKLLFHIHTAITPDHWPIYSTGTSEGRTYIHPPTITEKIECLRTSDLGVLFEHVGYPAKYCDEEIQHLRQVSRSDLIIRSEIPGFSLLCAGPADWFGLANNTRDVANLVNPGNGNEAPAGREESGK